MIKDFAKAWTKYKGDLQERIAESETHTSWNYDDLLKMLFETVVNPYLDEQGCQVFDVKNFKVIDDGCYSGTRLFILHRGCMPDVGDYIYTSVYYGSCCVCDVLQGIQAKYLEDKAPDAEQVKDYMCECLHLLQNCYYMRDNE